MEGNHSNPCIAYDLLKQPPVILPEALCVSPEDAYIRYHKMHKVIVGPAGSKQLEYVYGSLKDSDYPEYLKTAGWAACEVVLANQSIDAQNRHAFLNAAEDCWMRALEIQISLMNEGSRLHLVEDSDTYRTALDIAHIPLLRALIDGDISPEVKLSVVEEALSVAQAAQVQLTLAKQEGNSTAVSDLSGLGYECNALLVLNIITDSRGFAIPSSPRAGSGHNYPNQTHDISYVLQHWGEVRKILPIEIKSHASSKERARYEALLVRGKMHLSVEGNYVPRATLDALTRIIDGTGSIKDFGVLATASENIIDLIKAYKRGQLLGQSATGRTPTKFHDKKFVRHMYTAA